MRYIFGEDPRAMALPNDIKGYIDRSVFDAGLLSTDACSMKSSRLEIRFLIYANPVSVVDQWQWQ